MIYAICGLQGSGKDTIGSYLIKKYGFVKLSFASVLKDIIAIVFDWDRELLEGTTKESREWREKVDEWWSCNLNIPNLTPRYVLQYFGTELFRNNFHQDIWIKILERKLLKYKNVVITDCRFPNEFDMLKQNNTIFIRVVRGNLPKWFVDYESSNFIENPVNIHPSEYLWIKQKTDYTITNDCSLEKMYETIDNIINTNLR